MPDPPGKLRGSGVRGMRPAVLSVHQQMGHFASAQASVFSGRVAAARTLQQGPFSRAWSVSPCPWTSPFLRPCPPVPVILSLVLLRRRDVPAALGAKHDPSFTDGSIVSPFLCLSLSLSLLFLANVFRVRHSSSSPLQVPAPFSQIRLPGALARFPSSREHLRCGAGCRSASREVALGVRVPRSPRPYSDLPPPSFPHRPQ